MANTEVSTPARVAIYARVSTNEQSPELQLRDLKQYATARGLSATEYVDTGFSGAKQSRPALDRLMDDARKRRFDCVVVWRFAALLGAPNIFYSRWKSFARSVFNSSHTRKTSTRPLRLDRRCSRLCPRSRNLSET